jgi:uncharacterized membrane protein YbhN (UPF0104 family)
MMFRMDSFWFNALANAVGTVVGGVVLAVLTGLFVRLATKIDDASGSGRDRVRIWMFFAAIPGAVSLAVFALVVWQRSGSGADAWGVVALGVAFAGLLAAALQELVWVTATLRHRREEQDERTERPDH